MITKLQTIVNYDLSENKLTLPFKNASKAISDEAKKVFDAFNTLPKNIIDNNDWDLFIKQNQLADSTLIDFLTDVNQSEKSLTAYQKYLKQTSSATSLFSQITSGAGKIMKIFAATAVNAFASVVVAKVIGEIIEAYDNWVHRIDNAKDAMEQSKESYGEVSDELDELRKQAHEAQAKMAQMERTGLIDDDEYKKLQETNAELEREIKLLEARQKVAATEAWDNAEDWYDKTRQHTFSGADTTYNEKASLNQENASYNNYELYDEAMIENNKDNINFLLGSYKGLSRLQEENIAKIEEEKDALESKDSTASQVALNTIKVYEDQNEVLNSNLADIQSYLDKYRSGLDDLVTAYEQKEQLGSYISSDDTAKYNEAIALIRIIDELLIGSSNNADQASESFSNAADAINRFEISDSTKAEALTKINALKDGFDSLKDLYNSISEDKALDFSILDEDFEQIFSGAEAYQDFIDVITDSPDDIKGCQEAFDNLIYSWLHSEDIMSVLNDETVEMIGAFLEEQGVVDATSWIMAELAARKEMASGKTDDLSEATREEVELFYDEYDAAENVKQALARLQLAKITLNGTVIDTSGDIDNLIALAEQAGATAEMLAATKNYNQVLQGYNATVGDDILESDYLDAQKKAKAELRSVIDYKPGEGKGSSGNNSSTSGYNPPSSSSKSSSSSSTKDPKQEEIDWIARRNEFLQKQHDITKKIAEDETATYNERKEALQDLIAQDEKRAEVAKTSAEHYKQAWLKASENLTTDDKLKITHDAESIDVETYDAQELLNSGIVDSLEAGEKYIENLKKAIEYWDLMKDSEEDEKQIREENLQHQRESLALLKEEAEHQLDLNATLADQVESRKELMEAQGQYINAGTYKELISLSKEEESILQDKLDTLQQQLNLEDEQTSAWYSLKAEIESAENALIQCQSTQADLNNTLKRLPIERLEIMRNFYSHIIEDMDHIIDLQSSMGLKPTKEQLQDYIGLYDEQIAKTLEEQEKLKDLLDDYEYGSDLYNQTADEIQNLDNELASMVKTQREYNNTLLEMPLNDVTEEVNSLTSARTALEEAISIKESEGLSKTLDDYQALQKVTEAEIGSLQKKRSVLSTLLETYAETYGTESDMYKDTLEQLNDVNSDINSLIQSQKQWNEELLQIPIDNILKASDAISGYKDEVQGVIDLNNAKGRQTSLDDYQKLSQANQVTLNTLTKEKVAYEEVLKSLDKNSAKYKEIEELISGIDDEIADCVKQQHEWNTEILQIPIKNLEAIGDSLSDYSSGIESILGDYDSAISAVTKAIDDQKEAIQEERDATEKLYDERIEKLNEEKDLLTQTNNDRKLQLDLDQKLYERDRARNQKTVAVMNADGELEYRSDMDALRDAEQGVADAQYNIKVNELEKEIKLLEESKAAELEKYDIKLDNLEKIKGKWSEIVEKIEAAVNAEKATELLGEGWQDKVLSGNDDDIRNKLQDDYSKYHNENVEVNELSESNDRLIQALGRIITAYQNGEMTYDQAQSELGKLTETAADGYSALEALSDKMRLDGISDFNQISSSLKEQLSTTSKQVSDNLKVVNDNAESVENHETTWEDLPGKLDKYVNSFNTSIKSLDKFVDTYNKNAAAIDQNVTSWESIQKYIDGQITSATYDVNIVKEYIDAFKANAKAIDENVSDWDEMKGLIDEQVKALKQAAEALEESQKESITVKYEREDRNDDTDNDDDSKPNGVYSGRYGYLYKYDHENGTLVHPTKGYDLEVKNYKEFMEMYEEKLKNGTYHKGIFKGAIGDSNSKLDKVLQDMAVLQNDERIIVGQDGEYVYQPEQILNTITNAQKMALPAMEPLLEHLLTQQTITGLNAFNQIDRIKDMVNTGSQSNLPLTNIGNTDKHVEVNFNGGITMHEVQDVEQFTYKLISTADSMISQKMSKIF